MPIHDWTRVPSGVYHSFHQDWTIEICRSLNRGILPEGFYAMADQRVSGPEPDVVALRLRGPEPAGGVAVAASPPSLPRGGQARTDASRYALKANRISIREELGRVVAIIEVVSPGNKDSRSSLRSFVGKVVDFLRHGIHLLAIDPFPSGPRDPEGLEQAIWTEMSDDPLPARPGNRPLTVLAIDAGEPMTAYCEASPWAIPGPMPRCFWLRVGTSICLWNRPIRRPGTSRPGRFGRWWRERPTSPPEPPDRRVAEEVRDNPPVFGIIAS